MSALNKKQIAIIVSIVTIIILVGIASFALIDEQKRQDMVKNCVPYDGPGIVDPYVFQFNATHSFNMSNCQWELIPVHDDLQFIGDGITITPASQQLINTYNQIIDKTHTLNDNYSSGQLTYNQYLLELDELRKDRTDLFQMVQEHDFGDDLKSHNFFYRGVMKFPDVLHETVPEIVMTDDSGLVNKTDTTLEEKGPIHSGCESLGLEKYPPNKLEEFLNSPYQKDTTKMNFTISDFDEIPLYKELIVRNQDAEYPLNDRVRFEVDFEEYQQIKSYLEQREHVQFWNYEHIVQDELGEYNEDGHYRHPEILIDGKLYGINGLNFRPLIAGEPIDLNIEQSWTLEEAQEYYHSKERKHRALAYFEIEDVDKEPLKILLDEIKKIGTYKDKLRDAMSVSSTEQDQAIDFFKKQNEIQFDGDDSKYTRFFFVDDIMYEYSFVVC